jgi:hypothetical protein
MGKLCAEHPLDTPHKLLLKLNWQEPPVRRRKEQKSPCVFCVPSFAKSCSAKGFLTVSNPVPRTTSLLEKVETLVKFFFRSWPPVGIQAVFILAGIVLLSQPASAQPAPSKTEENINSMILDIVHQMPQGGGYSVKHPAMVAMISAVSLDAVGSPSPLSIKPALAKPSFCSEATYLVFIALVNELQAKKTINLSSEDLKALLITGQPDGEGIWGRWNANGPGTARLFYELHLGRNFQSLSQAQPGDFLKIFWTDEIGAKEFGHSVIFLGTHATPEGQVMRIWSSNSGVGYSEKDVPMTKIKRMLFSRLSDPSALKSIAQLPRKDAYLAGLMTNVSSEEEMSSMVGIEDTDQHL